MTKLKGFQFKPYNYNLITRKIAVTKCNSNSEGNSLYIREINFTVDRVISSSKINVSKDYLV
jgi:hypothetical protein